MHVLNANIIWNSTRKAACIIFLFLEINAFAQQPQEQIQDALEDWAEQSEEESDDDEMWQQLQVYLQHPLNLNTATAGELEIFPFLNRLQIESILQYRRLLGDFISIYELQAVPQLDLPTIRDLQPYVAIGNDNPFTSSYRLRDFFHKGDWQMLFRYKRDVEKKRGFIKDSLDHTHYLGDPNALFFRAAYQFPGHLSIGITADRDAGEPFTGYRQKGFDFYAFHIYLKDFKKINGLVLGDYRINLGQGLVNRQGLTFGKSSMVMNTDRSGPALRPHTSAMEYGFYRGIAIDVGKRRFNTIAFVSYTLEDAHIMLSDSLSRYFNGFQSSGYHRSENELGNKNTVKHLSGGGSFRYRFSKGHIALNTVYHHFSDSMKRSAQLYDLYGAEGKSMINASLDYAFFLDKLYFYGETASDKEGNLATVNGLLMSANRHVDLSLLYRNYSKKYNSLYARSFGENSEPKNENGFYGGVTLRPLKYWQMDAYADVFRFPWLKYRVDAPSSGREYFTQITYTPSKTLTGYFRYRNKHKALNVLTDEPLADVVMTHRQNIRFQIQWKGSEYFSFRTRGERIIFRRAGNSRSHGYYAAQDVLWKTNKRVNGNMRLAWFNTDDYDTRLYAYENDVRFSYSIPFFYGKGIRSYVNLRANVGRRMSLWLKLARTWYFDQQTIGSGWDEIAGNKRTNLTVQMIWNP